MTTRAAGAQSETARQLVHVSMGAFALLLRYLSWPQAVAFALSALLFNVFVLPRVARRLYRPGDHARALHGIVYYPGAVLLLLVAFPHRPDIVAAAWGILAAGDGLATLAGLAIGGPRWPWNREKTVSGTVAFALAGAAAGAGLAWWCRPATVPLPSPLFSLLAPVAAAVFAALVETIPVRLDDNLSVAAAAGGAMAVASLVDLGRLSDAGPIVFGRLPAAVLANAAVAAAGYLARTVTFAGALTGAAIGMAIYVSTGPQGWTLLLATFAAAILSSRMGLQRKIVLGIAEERGGRRGFGNAVANTGVAAAASILVLCSPFEALAGIAFVTALAAGGSDTIASEIGKAFGRQTVSITSLRRVAPGTSGALSLEGTAAGIAGAFALGALGIALGIAAPPTLVPIVAGCTAGSLIESWLGATLEGPGIVNNDMLNFINTGAAASIAVALCLWLA